MISSMEEDNVQEQASFSFPAIFRGGKIYSILLSILIIGYAILFSLLSVMRFDNLRSSGVDSAIFNQVMYLMSRLEAPVSSIRGVNIFGDHFGPLLVLLVPFYRLLGGIYFLLVFQTLTVSLGAVPVFLLAKERTKSGFPAIALAFSYLCYPALQHMNLFDFHPEALAVTFFLLAFFFLHKRKFGLFYAFCFLALLCKEDMALAVFVLGLIAYFRYDRKAGKIVTGVSLAYFIMVVLLVIPSFGEEGFQYTGRLSAFGRSPAEAAKNMIIQPGRTLSIIATRQNLRLVMDLLAPTAFLPLLFPVLLFPALPALFINLISDFHGQHTILYQYTAAITPFVFLAAAFALGRLSVWLDESSAKRKVIGAIGVLIILSATAGSFYLGPGPLSERWDFSRYRSDKGVEALKEAIKTVPGDARVSAQIYILPHMSSRKYVYMFPNPFIDYIDLDYYRSLPRDQRKFMFPGIYRRLERGARRSRIRVPEVDFVILSKGVDRWPLSFEEYDRMIERILESGKFVKRLENDGVLVLQRKR